MSRTPTATLLYFVFIIAAASARANDLTAELALGGLTFTKTAAISMDSEDLYISRDRVHVKYRFTNASDAPIHTLVAFPLPDIPPATDDDDEKTFLGDPVSDLRFKTYVDGQPLALQLVEQAIFRDQDVSARLLALHIPLNRFADGFKETVTRLPQADRHRLLTDGFIEEAGANDEPEWRAQWALRTTLTRDQTFPARKTVVVEHEYTPITGGSVAGSFGTEERRKYCIDDEWLVSVHKKLENHSQDNPYSEIWLGYVLTTGANWKGPIGDFRLVVDKGKPDSLVSFCADGVKKISPTQFEVHRANFSPKADLDVLIIDWTNSTGGDEHRSRGRSTPSKDCLTDGRILTMRGTVVERTFTDYDQGKPFKHRYIALEFYRPRCTIAEYSESETSAMFEQLDDTSQYWVGRHVIARVKVSETGGTIHYPTSVVLTPIDIQEESQ